MTVSACRGPKVHARLSRCLFGGIPGNGALPITPRHGVISYPKKNRHLRFQVMAAFDRYPCSLPLIANVLLACVRALRTCTHCPKHLLTVQSISNALDSVSERCVPANALDSGRRASKCMHAGVHHVCSVDDVCVGG